MVVTFYELPKVNSGKKKTFSSINDLSLLIISLGMNGDMVIVALYLFTRLPRQNTPRSSQGHFKWAHK